MNIQTLAYLPTILGIVVIAAFTFYRRQKKSAIIFSAFSFLIALWLLTQYFIQIELFHSPLFFAQLTDLISNYLAYTFLLFIYFYVNTNRKLTDHKLMWSAILFPLLIFSALSFSGLMIQQIEVTSTGFAIKEVGVLYFVQIAYIAILFLVGFIYLIIDTVKKSKTERPQNYLLIFGLLQAVVLNLIINTVFATNASTQLLVPLTLFIMVVVIAFAIIRHQLFDIRLVAVRAVTYSFTILIIGFLYGFIAFTFIGNVFGSISGTSLQLLDTILAVALAFTFQPIRRFFERITTNIFYRDHYDSQELINEVGRILASEIDLDKVSNRVLHEITKQIKIDKGEIVVFGEKQLFYENNVFKNGGAEISSKELRKLGRLMVVADDLKSGERKDLLQKYGVSISLSLRTSEKFIGYMLLGEKKSGDIYNDEDLKVLKTIANEVSIAMANALSYKEIQLFSETLAEKVRQRTAQLHRANDQLRDLDKAKDEFISMASHQLRTPLTTVKGYASMLEEGDFGKLTKSQQEKVDLTLDGANRMARLIDDLLNVSRMDANRFFLEVTPVDLNKLVEQEVGQLQTMAAGKNVKLTYTPPREKIPNIRLDETKTRQVVMNLVDNAIHYSKPEGGEVEVQMVHAGDSVIFEVHDNGIGVPVDAQHKLFTKMFRANNAKDVRPDGTGLGLYLVKRVVQDEGGQIVFESQEGKGSTFGFKIPLSGVPKEVEAASKKIGARVAASHK